MTCITKKTKKNKWRLSNCLLFAACRAIRNGEYIVIRKTRQDYMWPLCKYHFLVVPKEIIDQYAESFVPDKKSLGAFPPPLFWGHVKKGD